MQARLKVMTPLLGAKTPSAPVGDKSGGDRRAARSLLSCALWRGMGRLWRGMGGMGRPEPLPAHRPHQQQGLSGFHETRITNHATRCSSSLRRLQAEQSQARPTGFSRNTKHESRITEFLSPGHGFPVHDCSPLFGIVHQKILRLSQYPLSVLTGNGACKVFTNHETEDKNHGLYAFHETRNTALPVHWPSDISSGANQASQPWFSRNTRHETRITAFIPAALRAASVAANTEGTHSEKGERSVLHDTYGRSTRYAAPAW